MNYLKEDEAIIASKLLNEVFKNKPYIGLGIVKEVNVHISEVKDVFSNFNITDLESRINETIQNPEIKKTYYTIAGISYDQKSKDYRLRMTCFNNNMSLLKVKSIDDYVNVKLSYHSNVIDNYFIRNANTKNVLKNKDVKKALKIIEILNGN